jgi:hypothetical protein
MRTDRWTQKHTANIQGIERVGDREGKTDPQKGRPCNGDKHGCNAEGVRNKGKRVTMTSSGSGRTQKSVHSDGNIFLF